LAIGYHPRRAHTLRSRNALDFFGGVPRRLVIDNLNLKAGITQASWWDDALVQATYRECAEHYGFLNRAVPPADA